MIISDSNTIELLIYNKGMAAESIVDKVKKTVSGKAIWGNKDDVPKFIKSRGGILS